jgi:conjugative relaxase-like TrwC/TraI family protein
MSAGSGYQYLLRSVAAGDGSRALSTPLTRYYSAVGTPPGRWLGSGVRAFGSGQLAAGMQVTEEQLALLIGMGRDPVTGEQFGRAYPSYKRLSDRIDERVAALDPEMTQEECAAETSRIEAEETAAGMRHAVAGFDLTFSVPKSVSVLWAVADAVTQERIADAHHAAVADLIDFFEREVASTRAGISDSDGAVAQVSVAGVAAVAYDHFDSRAGDPQLHTHVVVSNKVLTVMDGRWRSLDGRPVFSSVTGLSAHYNALLADCLSRDIGIEWELRERGADRNPQWEIVGVSDELIAEFSSRAREIELKKDELIGEYVAKAVLPHMRAQGSGRIINVSSLSGFIPSPFMALYVATKHAVNGYSQSLDHEVRDQGIRVLLVEPGPINTPFAGHSVEADTPMPLYAAGRRNYDELLEKNLSSGDDPAVVEAITRDEAPEPVATWLRRPQL